MVSITTTRARSHLPELIDDVRVNKEVVMLLKRGKPVAVLMSLERLKQLEELEDRYWAMELEHAMKEGELIGSRKTAQWLKKKSVR